MCVLLLKKEHFIKGEVNLKSLSYVFFSLIIVYKISSFKFEILKVYDVQIKFIT